MALSFVLEIKFTEIIVRARARALSRRKCASAARVSTFINSARSRDALDARDKVD